MEVAARGQPTLSGWITRDVLLTAFFVSGMAVGYVLEQRYDSLVVVVPTAVFSFVAAYALCYIVHEWGHYLGARISGITMPLSPYKSALLGKFEIEEFSRQQYLALSYGGDLGHVLVTVLGILLFAFYDFGVAGAWFAIGGLAFSVQALAVDLPIVFKVRGGADIIATADAGTQPSLILRRTWQTWLPLAGLLALVWGASA